MNCQNGQNGQNNGQNFSWTNAHAGVLKGSILSPFIILNLYKLFSR